MLAGKRRQNPADAARIVDRWASRFPIHLGDPACLGDAMAAVRWHRLAFWDAFLWATARRAGCGAIVSEDFQDGRELGGVLFINPFARNPSAPLADLLGPAGSDRRASRRAGEGRGPWMQTIAPKA